ncbi:hypothetical protein ACPA54_12430 [Uniformispora flossi]|uniref:hypothetical protein n=1 Tax=Uniformispora flossi TaxID=3390723 RepID=UPI003C2FFF71
MANPTHYPPGTAAAPGLHPPEPPRNARGETPIETERRWLGNIVSVTFPVILAGKLLKPKYRHGRPDPMMENVNRARAWLGLTLVFGVFLAIFYRHRKNNTPLMPNMPVTNGMPAPGPTSSPIGEALANGALPTPMPQATGLPTNFPTNYPTDLSSLFPSGYPKLPTNFSTSMPTGIPTGRTVDPGLQKLQDQSTDMVGKANNMLDALSVGQEAVSSIVHRIVLAPIFCALGIVVIGVLLSLFAHPHVRDHTVRQLVHPIKVIFIFCGVMAVGITAYVLVRNAAGTKHKVFLINKDGTQKELILSWVAAFIAVWCILFAVGALWQVTKHLFAAADGHPLLLPLLTIWLAWTMTVNDLTLKLGDGLLNGLAAGSNTVPDNVKAGTGVLGATIISVLAIWEMSRLHKWNGINFRSGPNGSR